MENNKKSKILFLTIGQKFLLDDIISIIIYHNTSSNNKNKYYILCFGIHKKFRKFGYGKYTLDEFIESKIGENWNDVYSEILTKIKKKYRQPIDDSLKYYVTRQVIYDEDFIPRTSTGRMLYDEIFIDLNNIIVKKTKEEILLEAKQLRRKRKLLEIIENQEKEKSNENNENESEDL